MAIKESDSYSLLWSPVKDFWWHRRQPAKLYAWSTLFMENVSDQILPTMALSRLCSSRRVRFKDRGTQKQL